MKVVILPLAFVLLAAVSIVFGALAMWFAILPLAFVLAAVCRVIDSEAMSIAAFVLAFEFVATVIVLNDIIWHF